MIIYYYPSYSAGPILQFLFTIAFVCGVSLFIGYHIISRIMIFRARRKYLKLDKGFKYKNLEIEKSMSNALNKIISHTELEYNVKVPQKLKKEIYYNYELLKLEDYFSKKNKKLENKDIKKIISLLYNMRIMYIREVNFGEREYNKDINEIWQYIFDKAGHDF